jgi:hypothetical protein
MILPLQGFDDSRPRKYAAWPPDLPRDQEREDVDYDSMFDLFYLKRNNKGDNFFDDIQPNTYFVTPRGIVLKRCGPRGWNPEFPHLKSLKRIGYPINSGYWQAKVGGGGARAGRSVMIHHLVYAAFGDIRSRRRCRGVYLCMCVCVGVCVYVCVCVCVYLNIYIYIHIHTYIYIHIYRVRHHQPTKKEERERGRWWGTGWGEG